MQVQEEVLYQKPVYLLCQEQGMIVIYSSNGYKKKWYQS